MEIRMTREVVGETMMPNDVDLASGLQPLANGELELGDVGLRVLQGPKPKQRSRHLVFPDVTLPRPTPQ